MWLTAFAIFITTEKGMTNDTQSCSGALKVFCTIIQSTEQRDSETLRPVSCTFLLDRPDGLH